MRSIRDVVDPVFTLPHVELKSNQVQEWESLRREKMMIFVNGECVGQCDIVLETNSHNQLAHFDGIEIDEGRRGHGIGMATYLLAIEHAHSTGLPFETQDSYLTKHSKTIWEKLAQLGIAEVVEPFQPSKAKEGKFKGKYRVPIPAE